MIFISSPKRIPRFIQSNTARTLAVVLAGLALGFAWPPFGIWPFALLSPGILLLSLRNTDSRSAFLLSFSYFTAAWTVAFHWNAFHPVSVTAASSVFALLAMISVLSALISTTYHASTRSTSLVGAALAIVVFDAFMMRGPVAMPGTMIGLSLSSSKLALGWASLLGVLGLSVIVILFNLCWVFAIMRPNFRGRALAVCVFILVLPFLTPRNTAPMGRPIQVSIIQPGVSPEKWADVHDPSKMDLFERLFDEARRKSPESALFILPETALPVAEEDSLSNMIRTLSDVVDADVISGGILQTEGHDFFNAIIAQSTLSKTVFYAKRRLVPFAEHVPFSNFIPFFKRFQLDSGGVSSYENGKDYRIFHTSGINIGLMICFESFFSVDGFRYRKGGADALVVVTQDGWWKSDAARAQHLSYTALLAASSGLPVLQASVDGYSGSFDARGNLVSKTSLGQSISQVELSSTKTQALYALYGDAPVLLFILCSSIAYLLLRYSRRNTLTKSR